MSDIAERLLAAIGKIEKAAFDATKSPWEWQDWGEVVELVHPMRTEDGKFTHPLNVLKCSREDWPPGQADRDHIALNHPEAVLRRCAADREIVELHKPAGTFTGTQQQYCSECGSGEPHEYPADWPCRTLLAVARGYGLEETP